MTSPTKQLTRKSVFGRWNFRSEDENIYVTIDRDEVEIAWCDDEDFLLVSERFPSQVSWMSDFLCFTEPEVKYFAGYANAAKMSFGEFETPGVAGNPKWIHVFSRVGMQ